MSVSGVHFEVAAHQVLTANHNRSAIPNAQSTRCMFIPMAAPSPTRTGTTLSVQIRIGGPRSHSRQRRAHPPPGHSDYSYYQRESVRVRKADAELKARTPHRDAGKYI